MNPLKAGDIAPKFSLPDQDGPPAVPYRPAAYAITWMS